LTVQSPLWIRAEESGDAEMQRSNVTHAHFIDVLEFMQKPHRKERAHVRGLASRTQDVVSPNDSGNAFSVLENDIDTDISELEDLIAEELEQLAITEEESTIMPDTPAEINEATAASVTRADMDMAVFCHGADEQGILRLGASGMWSEVHLLHRLRVIFEQEALPIDDPEELEMARRVRFVMADLSTPANNPVTPNNQSTTDKLPPPEATGSSAATVQETPGCPRCPATPSKREA
jgi:hypothetical protein